MHDAGLAIVHHLLFFGLALMVAMQLALTREGLGAAEVRRLAGLDRGYGLTAVLVLAAGAARVWMGPKGADYYLSNPWFWAKMAAFAVMGLLSIGPTIAFLRWSRALKASPDALPCISAVASVRRFLRAEIGLLLLIPVFAALMARYQG